MKKTLFAIISIGGAMALMVFAVAPQKPYFFFRDVARFFSLSSLIEENITLKQENNDLRSHLLALSLHVVTSQNNIAAKVFSFYPLNVKSSLTIDKGSADGVTQGDGILFGSGVFVGRVVALSAHAADVITIFDPSFSLSVRIGDDEIDGLLEGGITPHVTLIDKGKSVAQGDVVFNAAEGSVYGSIVGTVDSLSSDSSGSFLEARLGVPYNLSDIRDIFIVPANHVPAS